MTAQPTLTLTGTGNLRIHIPMHIRRMRGRKRIFAPQALDGGIPDCLPEVQSALVQALGKAFSWSDAIENGEFSSVAELARHLDIDNSYVVRILKLTTLAPDIIEAILNGEEPSGLSLARLIRTFSPGTGSGRESTSGSSRAEPPPAVADGPGPVPHCQLPSLEPPACDVGAACSPSGRSSSVPSFRAGYWPPSPFLPGERFGAFRLRSSFQLD